MQNQYYLNFYSKAIIPAKPHCLDFLSDQVGNLPHSSYWLIAIEGKPKSNMNEAYIWKVTIYPTDKDGNYTANAPCYSSNYYDCLDNALENSRQLEREIKNPPVTSQTKIS
jgi:hypothetical protein